MNALRHRTGGVMTEAVVLEAAGPVSSRGFWGDAWRRLRRNKASMVAATPICNSIFSAMLNGSGYNQAADVALGTAAQTASVQTAISVSYIWVETVCYIIGAVILILFWTVEKNLPEEQKAIKERSKK